MSDQETTLPISLSLTRSSLDHQIPCHGSGQYESDPDSSTAVESDAIFRFFNLPPELRNNIYGKLLRFEEASLTCHPQILRACKKVQREASSYLYGGNELIINIHQDRVEAHGVRCGVYKPVVTGDLGSRPYDCTYGMSSIEWPDFVSRMWSYKVAAPSLTWYYDEPRSWPVSDRSRRAIINNVLYSLYSLLRAKPKTGHRIRRMGLGPGIVWSLAADDVCMSLYPVRLIGVEKAFSSRADDKTRVVYCLQDCTAYHQAAILRKGVLAPSVALILRIDKIYLQVLKLIPYMSWMRVTYVRFRCIWWLAHGVANRLGLISDNAMERMLAYSIAWVRDLAVGEIWNDRQEVLNEIDQILLLEVELRAPPKA